MHLARKADKRHKLHYHTWSLYIVCVFWLANIVTLNIPRIKQSSVIFAYFIKTIKGEMELLNTR